MTTVVDASQDHRGPIRRFDAVAGGPIWWACHLGASYWLIPRTCRWAQEWPLHLVTVVFVALIGRALLSGVQVLRAARAAPEHDPARSRDIFIGCVGIAFSVLFGAVTLAEWFPVLNLSPCW